MSDRQKALRRRGASCSVRGGTYRHVQAWKQKGRAPMKNGNGLSGQLFVRHALKPLRFAEDRVDATADEITQLTAILRHSTDSALHSHLKFASSITSMWSNYRTIYVPHCSRFAHVEVMEGILSWWSWTCDASVMQTLCGVSEDGSQNDEDNRTSSSFCAMRTTTGSRPLPNAYAGVLPVPASIPRVLTSCPHRQRPRTSPAPLKHSQPQRIRGGCSLGQDGGRYNRILVKVQGIETSLA